jgi:hypothetical protein
MFSLAINHTTDSASTATVEVYLRGRRTLNMDRKVGQSVSLAAMCVR